MDRNGLRTVGVAAALMLTVSVSGLAAAAQAEPDEAEAVDTLDAPGAASAPSDGGDDRHGDEGPGEGGQDEGADEVTTDDLLRRHQSPAVEPTREPGREQVPERVGVPAPRVDVDPSVLGVPPGEEVPRLRREGEFIVNRPGRIVRPEGLSEWIFQPLPQDDEATALPPMVLQPTGRLEMIETYLQDDEDHDGPFEVSGRLHTYRGVNYLLLTQARPQVSGTDEGDADEAAVDGAEARPGAEADDDADTDTDTDTAAEEDAALQALLRQRQAAPSAVPARGSGPGGDAAAGGAAPAVAGHAPDGGAVTLREEGSLMMQRRGRLIRSRDGVHVLFVLEADDRESPEAPLILQPSQLLETMEDIVQERGDQVVFVVSGQVHTYHGANYLLPTMMRLSPDRGNLQN